jgi:hypothetical protein
VAAGYQRFFGREDHIADFCVTPKHDAVVATVELLPVAGQRAGAVADDEHRRSLSMVSDLGNVRTVQCPCDTGKYRGAGNLAEDRSRPHLFI